MTGQFDYELKPRKIRARFHEHKHTSLARLVGCSQKFAAGFGRWHHACSRKGQSPPCLSKAGQKDDMYRRTE
jgi:hypothetical protein